VSTDDPPPEPSLDEKERALLVKGVDLLNRRLFYECHDTLEELWMSVRGPSREFFQGLIQAAVGLYHLGNGNREGARRLFDRALARLGRYPARYAGVDAWLLREALARFRDALAAGGPLPAEEPPAVALLSPEADP
jgi:predicted metal-dependent hydrolase